MCWSCDEPELKIEGVASGRKDRVKVSVSADRGSALIGQIIPVKIVKAQTFSLYGEAELQ